MQLTLEKVERLLDRNPHVEKWYDALYLFLDAYEIHTPKRIAAFIAQCAHESANFNNLEENLNYRWQTLRKVFPKYFPTDTLAQEYANKPIS